MLGELIYLFELEDKISLVWLMTLGAEWKKKCRQWGETRLCQGSSTVAVEATSFLSSFSSLIHQESSKAVMRGHLRKWSYHGPRSRWDLNTMKKRRIFLLMLLSICLFVCQSLCLSVFLFVCLYVCMCLTKFVAICCLRGPLRNISHVSFST